MAHNSKFTLMSWSCDELTVFSLNPKFSGINLSLRLIDLNFSLIYAGFILGVIDCIFRVICCSKLMLPSYTSAGEVIVATVTTAAKV